MCLFICEFCVRGPNSGTYLPRITRPTCILLVINVNSIQLNLTLQVLFQLIFKIFFKYHELDVKEFYDAGKQTFEKMISGMYMGELTRQVNSNFHRISHDLLPYIYFVNNGVFRHVLVKHFSLKFTSKATRFEQKTPNSLTFQ